MCDPNFQDDLADSVLAEMELAAIDENGDGVCSFEELWQWWCKGGRRTLPHDLPGDDDVELD
jgi:hypothetical protein